MANLYIHHEDNMKLYLITSYAYGFDIYHGVVDEARYKKIKSSLKKKAVVVQAIDTDKRVDLRKLPNK